VPTENYADWAMKNTRRIFSLDTLQAKIVVFSINAGGTITLILLGLPFSSPILNIILIIGMQFIYLVYSLSVYSLISMLIFFFEISTYPVSVPFYRSNHPAVRKFLTTYSRSSFLTLIAYSLGVFMIWQGPYEFTPEIVAWLTILSFLPLSMFSWSFFQAHRLLRRIKENHIDFINHKIQNIANSVEQDMTKDSLEILSKLMDIQKSVESTQEWPIAFEGVFTFLVTLIIPIIQVVLSVFE
jgi:hypothetical protein